MSILKDFIDFHKQFTHQEPQKATIKEGTVTYLRFNQRNEDAMEKFCAWNGSRHDDFTPTRNTVTGRYVLGSKKGDRYILDDDTVVIRRGDGSLYVCNIAVFRKNHTEVDDD